MRNDRKSAYFRASWTASVGKMRRRLFRSSKSREQKNEAPSCPSAKTLSAIVWAIAVFPVRASPFNQYTGDASEFLAHSSILSKIALRVPFRQPLQLSCHNSTCCEQGKPSRTAASSAGRLGQAPMIENGMCSNLSSAGRSFHLRGRERRKLTISLRS